MMDIFATVIAAAGGEMPTNHQMDGKSLLPLLLGQNASSPHEALFHYCGDTLMAVRYKQYKLRYYTEQVRRPGLVRALLSHPRRVRCCRRFLVCV
jgi:arylsulfatase A-like enzyme